jgi:hypothetical protein
MLEYEYKLRKGQAFGALKEIRSLLIIRTHEYKYMDKSLNGVRAKTRSATRSKAIGARLTHAEDKYRVARTALVSLGAMLNLDEWQQHLLVLNADDVRPRPSKAFGDEEWQKGSRRKKQKLDAEALAREAERKAEEKRLMS